jgi:chemotaxis protein MotB
VADESRNEQPIIIKRIKKSHGGHHGGAWKVAFADFMTAMMAFFLVMWLVGQDDRIKEAVAGYFRDPGKFMQSGQSGVLKGSTGVISTEASKASVVEAQSKKEYAPSKEEQERFALIAQEILKELEKQEAFQRVKKNVKLQVTSEGLRIILNESEDAPAFFEPGSAKLLQKSAIILATIAREIGKLTNHIVIEGHTDAVRSGGAEYSNWELSADRANAARELMDVSGLYKGQVREVRGFASNFPMILDNPADPRNRRVTLVVLYESRERMYDQIEVGADLQLQVGG